MDFFERLFHINLDNGSGSLEALYVVVFVGAALAAAVSGLRLHRRAAKRHTDRRG